MRSLVLVMALHATALSGAAAGMQKDLAAPLNGYWRGQEITGDHGRYVTVAFEGDAGTLTYEHGTVSIGLRIRSLRVDRAQVSFSITAPGGVRHYVGTHSGARIGGRILSDGPSGRDLGSFELRRRADTEREGAAPAGPGLPVSPLNGRGPSGPASSGAVASAPASEVDELREAGRKRLQDAMARLQNQAANLGELVRYYDARCRTPQWTNQAATIRETSCMEVLQAIGMLGIAIGHGLQQAEEDARRAWLEPGIVRQMREHHGLDHRAWDQLSSAVRRFEEEARKGTR